MTGGARGMTGGGMAGGALHGVGVSTASFRALVVESSHSRIKPFRCDFLDAATTRSMTVGRNMAGGCTQHDRVRARYRPGATEIRSLLAILKAMDLRLAAQPVKRPAIPT